MEKYIAEKILDVHESLLGDGEYQKLVAEHERLNARFLETVSALTKTQRTAIFDYLGLLTEMQTKQLEQACK